MANLSVLMCCNKNASRYISLVDARPYGVWHDSWLPIHLLTVKHFSKEHERRVSLFFEWAAIPPRHWQAGCQDKLFKAAECR